MFKHSTENNTDKVCFVFVIAKTATSLAGVHSVQCALSAKRMSYSTNKRAEIVPGLGLICIRVRFLFNFGFGFGFMLI